MIIVLSIKSPASCFVGAVTRMTLVRYFSIVLVTLTSLVAWADKSATILDTSENSVLVRSASKDISLAGRATAKANVYNHWSRGAIKGADPVALFSLDKGAKPLQGVEQYYYDWQGARWFFVNLKNRDMFAENPEKYAPQFGGYCAFGVAKNYLIAPRIDNWAIVNGKLYFGNNTTTFNLWLANSSEYISRAVANWPSLLTHSKTEEAYSPPMPSYLEAPDLVPQTVQELEPIE